MDAKVIVRTVVLVSVCVLKNGQDIRTIELRNLILPTAEL